MTHASEKYILDTSAIFAFLEDEDGADQVLGLLNDTVAGGNACCVVFVSVMEVYYITLQERGRSEANRRVELLGKLGMPRMESTPELAIAAGELKAKHKISFADAWIAAAAKMHGAVLVHKDPEFEQVEDEVSVLKLPYRA